MLKNYFLVAFRTLLRDRFNSFVNITSLSLGLACAVLIYLYAKNELTYDTFHSKSDRIYRAWVQEKWNNGEEYNNTITPLRLGPEIKANIPEVEAFTRIVSRSAMAQVGDVVTEVNYDLIDEGFAEIFDLKVVSGSLKGAFSEPNNVVLTKTQSKTLFGDSNPVGETFDLRLTDTFQPVVVKAVVEDMPSNSSLRYTILLSGAHFNSLYSDRQRNAWFSIYGETYVLAKEGVDMATLSDKLSIVENMPKHESLVSFDIEAQPLKDIHLNVEVPSGYAEVNDPKYIFILSFIAVFILVIGSINFTTLNIGKSITRAKEIGVRKVNGATRGNLIIQFLSEALVITGVSLLIGVVVAYFSLNSFNQLAGKQLTFFLSGADVAFLVGLTIINALLSGLYPAFILSGFNPVESFKGKVVLGKGKQVFRKSLVVVQFVLSAFMISTAIFIQNQMSFLQNTNLGFEEEALVVLPLDIAADGMGAAIEKGFVEGEKLKNEMEKMPEVAKAGMASHTFGAGDWVYIDFTDPDGNVRKFKFNPVSYGFIETAGIKMIQGRSFDRSQPSDATRAVVVNEAFVKAFGMENPVGSQIPGNRYNELQVIGVVKDFHFNSLHQVIDPMMMAINWKEVMNGSDNISFDASPRPKVFLSLSTQNLPATIDKIEKVWASVYPNSPFNYEFVDERLATQYARERNLSNIVAIGTALTVLISCLGLLSLATLTLNGRLKEISIRKVLGAPIGTLLFLLIKEFVVLILVSAVVAVPLVVLFMQDWLQNFAYRIPLNVWPFVAGVGVLLFFSLTSIGFKVLKAVTVSATKTLKSE